MNELVFLSENQAVTSTIVIAENTLLEHASVIKLTRQYLSDLEIFGQVDFKSTRPDRGGHDIEYALLNERQATLLISYMRNSDIVRQFKIRLVTEFYNMAEQLRARSFLPDFTNPAAAARAWADATENAQKQEAIARALAQQIETDKPDTYIGRTLRGDESKTYGLRDWISLIKKDHANIKERVVIKWLLDNKYIYRKGDNTLAAYSVYAKYFSLHEPVINGVMRKMLKITAKGVMTLTPLIIDHFSNAEL